MNNSHPKQILEQLQQLGLIQPSAPSNVNEQNERDETPWFLHLFFGFSGLLSSILLVGFLTLILSQADLLESLGLQLLFGIVLSTTAFAIFKHKKSHLNTFWNSLAFALSGAGQLYLIFALFGNEFINNISHPLSVWLLLLLQVLMLIIMPNIVHRLLSCMLALGCVVYLLGFYHLPEVGLGLLAIIASVANLQCYQLLQSVPIKWRSAGFSISKASAYASALMLLAVSVYFIAAEYGDSFGQYNEAFRYNYYLAQGLLTLASLYAAYLILKRYDVKLLSAALLFIGGAIVLLGIISIYVSGLLATSLIIVIAVANSQRILLGLGIVALVSYIFWYYYQLDTSLLLKSASMLVIGITLLLIRWLIIKRYFADKTFGNTELISLTTSASINQERLP